MRAGLIASASLAEIGRKLRWLLVKAPSNCAKRLGAASPAIM